MAFLRLVILVWVQVYLAGPELLKVPLLFTHYYEHESLDGPLGFGDFIALHYADPEHGSADHSEHGDLPFHHHHGSTADQCSGKVWFTESQRIPALLATGGERPKGLSSDDDALTGFARTLLQPPKGLA